MHRFAVLSTLIGLLCLPAAGDQVPSSGPTGGGARTRPADLGVRLGAPRVASAEFSGPERAVRALRGRGVRPLSLATSDFDEDGVPDVVCGYRSGREGIVALHRGNVDAIYPNAPEARARRAAGTFTPEAFLLEAQVFETPDVPDFLGAGDFDADGHWDVVIASRAGKRLRWHRGDGRGGFSPAETIDLPGRPTALVTGEINRRDGLEDVVVAVDLPDGPEALVFEAPEGALRRRPERLSLPAPATSLALGAMDEDVALDLLAAADEHLLFVHGRDRRLGWAEPGHEPVVPARVEQVRLPFAVTSVATGRFDGDASTSVALMSTEGSLYVAPLAAFLEMAHDGMAPESSLPEPIALQAPGATLLATGIASHKGADLLVVDRSSRRMMVLLPPDDSPATASAVPTADTRAPRPGGAGRARGLATLPVDLDAAAVLPMRLGPDALDDLAILAGDPAALRVLPAGPLSPFTVTSTADPGDGVCDSVCTLREAVAAADADPDASTIEFDIAGAAPHTIFILSPLEVQHPALIDGTTQPGYGTHPVVAIDGSLMSGGSSDIILHDSITLRGLALHSAPTAVLLLEAGNVVDGCFIGTDVTGTVALPNGDGLGVSQTSSDNLIGGTVPAARNLISGNRNFEMVLDGQRDDVRGNWIGVDVTGNSMLGAADDGVVVRHPAADVTIGGVLPGAGNLVLNSRSGIVLNGTGHVVQGNTIGLFANGTAGLGGSFGGVGLSAEGSAPSRLHLVGGTTPAARNVISGHAGDGVRLTGPARDNIVAGNFIGMDRTGTAAVPNGRVGVRFAFGPLFNLIGGVSGRNVISGNGEVGVGFHDDNTAGNKIANNLIGPAGDGATLVGNGEGGILITDATANLIGDSDAAGGNVIAGNGGWGVRVRGANATGNTIRANSIHDNAGLGIDLEPTGVNPNDSLDMDVGPNTLQNYPILTLAHTTGADIRMEGSLTSTPSTQFRIDFYVSPQCDELGNGEGATWLGSTMVTTDLAGFASIGRTLDVEVPFGMQSTATASYLPGDGTSEFSPCQPTVAIPPPALTGLVFTTANPLTIAWDASAAALFYHLYVGTASTLSGLATQAPDACEATALSEPGGTLPPGTNPPVGEMIWFLATAEGIYGEGPVQPGYPKPRILNSVGACGDSCAHDPCVTGGPLVPACAPCASIVCDKDPHCCSPQGAWDLQCIQQVRTVCRSLTCAESQGQCPHNLCDPDAGPLPPGCDTPPLPVSCTAAVCQADPHCCQQAWDEACIATMERVCAYNCI